MTDDFDVIIIGGGPAGSAAALTLRKRGVQRVAIIEKSDFSRPRIGETIPPDTNLLLREMGLIDLIRSQGHLPCHGSTSAWGDRVPGYNDFIVNPCGHGWHLDRLLFDRTLLEEAARQGVTHYRDAEFVSVSRNCSGESEVVIRLACGENRMLAAPFIVDASGQSAVVARSMGARKLYDDRLVVISAVFLTGQDIGNSTWLEGAPDGWWYASQVPGRKIIVALGTDPKQAKAKGLYDLPDWLMSLAGTDHIAGLLQKARLEKAELTVSRAHSFRSDRVTGRNWVAVGDAAMGFDPLSSAGIYKALNTGRQAAIAVTSPDTGSALEDYARRIEADHAEYVLLRTQLYDAETRWRDAEFWLQRQSSRETVPA